MIANATSPLRTAPVAPEQITATARDTVAASSALASPFVMPAPPDLHRRRVAIDIEDLYALQQQSITNHIQTSRQSAHEAAAVREKNAADQKLKAEEALQAERSKGFWDDFVSVFSWIGKGLGLIAAAAVGVVTGGLAAVAAACALAHMVLEESGLYKKMGAFGSWLSSALQMGASLGHIASAVCTFIDQAMEKAGFYEHMGKWAAVVRAGLAVTSAVTTLCSKSGATFNPKDLSGWTKTLVATTQIAGGVAEVTAGAGQIRSAFLQHDADMARIGAERLRVENDKLKRLILDLIDHIEDEMDRKNRIAGVQNDTQEKRHEMRARLVSAARV